MKKISALLLSGVLLFSAQGIVANASGQSLDDVLGNSSVSEDTGYDNGGAYGNSGDSAIDFVDNVMNQGQVGNQGYIDSMKDAADLSEQSPGAAKVNQGLKKIVSIIVQVLCYAITAFLAVKVLLDLAYIALPFARNILANGYSGQAGGQQGAAGGMSGGMSGGMGMGGGFGGGSQFGGGGMGIGGARGGMGAGGQQAQAGAKMQLVSDEALNAVAAAKQPGPDGRAMSPYKIYAKDMVIYLVAVPVLLVLAVSGVLTDLGFLIGELIAKLLSGIGNMM